MKNTKRSKKKKKKTKPAQPRRPYTVRAPSRLVTDDGTNVIIQGSMYSPPEAERFGLEVLRAAARVLARQQVIVEVRRSIGSMT